MPMASAWLPVVAALGGTALGAAGSAVPAYLEHLRAKVRDTWEREQLERQEAVAGREATRLALDECVNTASDYLTARVTSRGAPSPIQRERMMAAWFRARLVVSATQQEVLDRVLLNAGQGDDSFTATVRAAVNDLARVDAAHERRDS